MRNFYFITCILIAFTSYTKAAYQQRAYVKPESFADTHYLGSAVAVSGDTMVVGGQQTEEAFVYIRVAGIWQYQATLTDPALGLFTTFGNHSVDIDGDTVIIGARRQDSNGAVYIYVRSGTTWTQQAKIFASNGELDDYFGHSAAISGDTIVVGAYREDSNSMADEANNSLSNAGAAYVFTRSAGVWTQDVYLKSDNPEWSAQFGIDVDIDGNNIIVGASGGNNNNGEVYLFNNDSGSWLQSDRISASSPSNNSRFGNAVAINNNTVVVGSNRESFDENGIIQTETQVSGAAYIYLITAGSLVEQAYLKAPVIDVNDSFGEDVGVFGDTVVIGVQEEDSDATGVDGTYNKLAEKSGAAYIYTRTASVWSQKHYIKASNTGADDFFGENVAIGSVGVVVGAHKEQSNATGINGDGDNDLLPSSGAVYTFDEEDFAPITLDNEYQLFINSTINVAVENNVLLDDIDPEGEILSVVNPGTYALSPIGGSLTINNDGSFAYTSPVSNTGTDVFNFEVTDGTITAPSVLTFVVSANTPPTAVNDSVTIDEDNSIAINVLDNDISNGSPTVIVNLFSQPSFGIVTNISSVLTYTPNENYCNDGTLADNFTYELNGGSTATVSVTVVCIDDIPDSGHDEYNTNENETIIMNVLDNDTDVDGGPQIITLITLISPSNAGTISITDNGSTVTYVPTANYCTHNSLRISFSYQLNGVSLSGAQVRVLVNCVNDEPSFNILGDVDLTENEDANIAINSFANNFVFGLDSDYENEQSVEDFLVTIIADINNTIDSIDVSNNGDLSLMLTNNKGLAIVSIALVDDGGTDFGGDNTSSPVEFTIDTGDFIFLNGFEVVTMNALVEKYSRLYQDKITIIDNDTISFLGHELYLDSYDKKQHDYILQQWLKQIVQLESLEANVN